MNALYTDNAAIGMLYIPINTILSAPPTWREALCLPAASTSDWNLFRRLRNLLTEVSKAKRSERDSKYLDEVRRLSFFSFLEQRMIDETAIYQEHGVDSLMIENAAAPYFIREQQPSVIYWVMRELAECLRSAHPNAKIGIQVLAFSDDCALEIACRCRLDFIRCESALFEGVRPEGRTPNAGNLAKLYMTRNMLMAQLGKNGPGPQVYVDVQKKHTVFMPGLDSLDVWLENILFQKLEGVIVTGLATGCPVEEKDLQQARDAIEKFKESSAAAVRSAWARPLIVGSGVSVENLAMCKRYADAVIVGSSLKKGGYWECALDAERVKLFAEAWHDC